jgi:hypothetical protein
MKVKPDDYTIPEDPFFDDLLNHKQVILNLIQLLDNSENSFVLSLNAPWGTGKTTFVKRWEQYLAKEKRFSFYYNAWENDYTKDAFASISTEFQKVISKSPGFKANDLIENLKTNTVKLIKIGLPFAARVATGGLVNSDELGKAISEFTEKAVSEKIKEFETAKEDLKIFKESLQAAILALYEKDQFKPVYIFIDELDRCRPTFAIEILETVKHFFNIPGLVVVLSIDKIQLSESMKAVYGSGFDSQNYLKRFIDLEYKLSVKSYEAIVNMYFQRFEIANIFRVNGSGSETFDERLLRETMILIFSVYQSTLRDIEKIFTIVSIMLKFSKGTEFVFPVIIAYISFLRFTDNEKFIDLLKKQIIDADYLKKESDYYKRNTSFSFNFPVLLESQIDIFLGNIDAIDSKINTMQLANEESKTRRESEYHQFFQKTNRSIDDIRKIKQFYLDKFDFIGNLEI